MKKYEITQGIKKIFLSKNSLKIYVYQISQSSRPSSIILLYFIRRNEEDVFSVKGDGTLLVKVETTNKTIVYKRQLKCTTDYSGLEGKCV